MSLKVQCQECPPDTCTRSYPKGLKTDLAKHFIPNNQILSVDERETQGLNGRLHTLTKEEIEWEALWTEQGELIFQGNPVVTYAYRTLKTKNLDLKRDISHDDPNVLVKHYNLTIASTKISPVFPIPTLETIQRISGRCLIPVSDPRVKYVIMKDIKDGRVSLIDCFHERCVTVSADFFRSIISFAKPAFHMQEGKFTPIRVETFVSPSASPKVTPKGSPLVLSPRSGSPSPQTSRSVTPTAIQNGHFLKEESEEELSSHPLPMSEKREDLLPDDLGHSVETRLSDKSDEEEESSPDSISTYAKLLSSLAIQRSPVEEEEELSPDTSISSSRQSSFPLGDIDEDVE